MHLSIRDIAHVVFACTAPSASKIPHSESVMEMQVLNDAGPKSVPSEPLQMASLHPAESTGCEQRGTQPFETAAI
jgi:hypothetical protein